MRNLKRALSLALASVMLIGMMVTGANALSFQDADEISNVTAATVLEELGIMVGDGTNFHPEQTVTRAEMAVIVCTILYGERLNVNQFVDGSKFTDVPEGHWANGYVNLANSLNIIVGYGDGTFGPNDPVTTAQATLMLTKALGWFRAGELVDNWTTDSMTIVTKGTQIGLFGDLKLANNEGLKRDNVAELTFNAITKAVPVMYNSTWDVYYTDSQNVLGGTKFDYRNTLGYENFSLAYDTGSDDFGRPTTRWGIGTIRNSGIVVDAQGNLLDGTTTLTESFLEVSKEADYTFTEKVTYKKLSDTIGRSNVRSYTWTINGGADKSGNSIDWTNDDDAIQATNSIVTGNGVLTQVYVREDADNSQKTTAQMFIVPYYVAQVDGSYNSSKGELRIVGLDGANALPTGTETTLSSDDFGNLASFNDEDYVLVTVAGKEVQSIELAEVITGSVDSYVDKKNVTVDGTQYKYTKNYRESSDEGYTLKNNYNIVLDKFGYVIFADGVGADEDYLYVLSAGKLGGAGNNMEIEAVFTDGTKKNVTLHNDSDGVGGIDFSNELVPSKWYKWEMKGGKYLLSVFPADIATHGGTPITSDNVKITENGKSTVVYGTGANENVPANSGTVFIVNRGDTISVYTGIRDVPDLKTKSTGGVTVAVVMDKKGYADYVYIDGAKDDLSSSGTAAGEYIFIVDAAHYATKLHSNGDDKVYEYEAVRNGVEEKIVSTSNTLEVGLYTDVSYDGDYVDSMTKVSGTGDDDFYQYGLDNSHFKYEGTVLSWTGTDAGSIALAKDCKVWTTDGDDLESSSGNGLASDYGENADSVTGNIYLVIKDNQATEVYVDAASTTSPVTPGPGRDEIEEILSNTQGNTATVEDPDLSSGIPTVPNGKTLQLEGQMTTGAISSSTGKVVLDNATITGSANNGKLDATGVADLTIGTTTIAADKTLAVKDATVKDVITVKDGGTLEVSGTITKEGDTAAIKGEEGAELKVTTATSGALVTLVDFYDKTNQKINDAADLNGKTFVWKEAWEETARTVGDKHDAGWYEKTETPPVQEGEAKITGANVTSSNSELTANATIDGTVIKVAVTGTPAANDTLTITPTTAQGASVSPDKVEVTYKSDTWETTGKTFTVTNGDKSTTYTIEVTTKAAGSETEISTVEFNNFTAPTAAGTLPTPTVKTTGVTAECKWTEKNQTTTVTTGEAGKTYVLTVELTAQSGYKLASSVSGSLGDVAGSWSNGALTFEFTIPAADAVTVELAVKDNDSLDGLTFGNADIGSKTLTATAKKNNEAVQDSVTYAWTVKLNNETINNTASTQEATLETLLAQGDEGSKVIHAGTYTVSVTATVDGKTSAPATQKITVAPKAITANDIVFDDFSIPEAGTAITNAGPKLVDTCKLVEIESATWTKKGETSAATGNFEQGEYSLVVTVKLVEATATDYTLDGNTIEVTLVDNDKVALTKNNDTEKYTLTYTVEVPAADAVG